MPRLLPYADDLLCGIVRATVPDTEVGTLVPADLAANPRRFVYLHRVGGAALDLEFLDVATVDVQTFAATRRGAADLADDVRAALYLAWRGQLVTAEGHLAAFREITGPSELRTGNQPDSLYRFQATYAASIRPPRPPVPN